MMMFIIKLASSLCCVLCPVCCLFVSFHSLIHRPRIFTHILYYTIYIRPPLFSLLSLFHRPRTVICIRHLVLLYTLSSHYSNFSFFHRPRICTHPLLLYPLSSHDSHSSTVPAFALILYYSTPSLLTTLSASLHSVCLSLEPLFLLY
jgi:hypothetical protein